MRNADRNGSDRRAKNLERAEDLLERLEPLVRSVVAGFTRDPATADELAQVLPDLPDLWTGATPRTIPTQRHTMCDMPLGPARLSVKSSRITRQ